MASVRFRHIDKRFPGGQRALSDLDLAVEDGELLVLVGPSGCGKSTALRLVAGLEQPSAGELLIDGAVVNDLAPQRRGVAMVFQNYALYPHMTVRQNLAFPLRMQRLRRAEIAERVERTARMLDLEALLDRRPAALSGGQRQRVAMGRAIVREARVSLMDEPLSNLDARLRVQIRSEIAQLQRRLGVTTLYVTHDQVEAMTLGQRVAVLRGGVLQQVDTPRALYERPANVFVAGFIGSPGMNLFRTRLRRAGDDELSVALGGSAGLALGGLTRIRHRELAPHIDAQVIVGLRPETVELCDGDCDLRGEVGAVESLGHETVLHLRTGLALLTAEGLDAGTRETDELPPLVVTLPGHHDIDIGERIGLRLDPDRLHLFDARGRAIG